MTSSSGPFGDRGLGTVDYILATILVALAVLFVVNQFGGALRGRFTVAGGCVQGLEVVDGEQWIACIPTPTPTTPPTPTPKPPPTPRPTPTLPPGQTHRCYTCHRANGPQDCGYEEHYSYGSCWSYIY